MTTNKKVLQQIEDAKRAVDSWPEWLRESVKLEGSDPYNQSTTRDSDAPNPGENQSSGRPK